jgi:hypothetical protein
MNGEWISTTDAALRLKVTPRHIRNKMMEIYQSGSDGVRKVVGTRGNPRWELNEDILYLFPNRGNKTSAKGKSKRKNKEELKGEISSTFQAETTSPIAEAIAEQFPQNIGEIKGEVLELGMHIQEDGTVAQVFTIEEFDTFRERLIELPILKKTVSELKDSYEAHIQTYESQVNYLRNRLEAQESIATRLLEAMKERNFIEATEKMKDRE